MTIITSSLPEQSVLKNNDTTYDYVDSYQGSFVDTNNTVTPTSIGKSFFKSGPKWVDHLFALRNKIAGWFGLKTPGNISSRQQMLDNFKGEEGEQMGLFKVFHKTAHEIVLGEDDKHLNFRVSLFIDQEISNNKKLIISTTVTFNNRFGRLYFLPVRPFHKLIVPIMLKGIIRDIEK